MKRRLAYTLGLIVAVVAVVASVRAGAITANGPYYAWPAWAQKLPASTRFVVMTNWNSDAVLDRETGLVWERSPDMTGRQWVLAQHHCKTRIVGSRLGWRLPTIEELTSLMEPSQPVDSLPAGHPFTQVSSAGTWSSTRDLVSPVLAWKSEFNGGPFPVFQSFDSDALQAWCVRGGQGSDMQ